MGRREALREQALAKLYEAKEVLDGAEDEGNVTASEQRRYDAAMAEAHRLLAKAELSPLPPGSTPQEGIARIAGTEPVRGLGTSIDGRIIPFPTGPGAIVNRDGVLALKPGEQIASAVGSTGEPDVSMSRLVRAIVTGESAGIPIQAAMGTGTGAGGGYMVPAPLANRIIDKARNAARVIQAGALTVPMTSSSLKIARVAGDPSAAWKLENAAAATSDMQLEAVELQAKTLVALVKGSVELFEDAQQVEDTIENALSAMLALELDRAALRGSGTGPEPRGVRNQTGVNIQAMGTNGAPLTSFDPFSVAIQTVQAANGDPNAILYSPRTSGALDRLKDSTGQPLRPPPSVEGITRLVTAQIGDAYTQGTAGNASDAFVGQWNELIIGVRTQLTIEVSREAADAIDSAFRQLQVWVRAYLRADVAVAQPSHFAAIVGIIP